MYHVFSGCSHGTLPEAIFNRQPPMYCERRSWKSEKGITVRRG